MRYALITIVALLVAGCKKPNLTPEEQAVRTVTNAESCTFIKSEYIESRPQVMHLYLQQATHRAGGDSYKIIDTSREVVMGTHIAMINFEIYRCR